MSEWKPGDVALVLNEHGVWNVAICAVRARHRGYIWSYGVADSWMPMSADARPLVIIDPEDAEQVERLADLYDAPLGKHKVFVHSLADALREFARPTPPECGRQLTVDLDTGRQGSHDRYVCRKPEGHDGRHQDVQAATTWDES